MENIGGDAPFSGSYGEDLEPEDFFGLYDDQEDDWIDPRSTDRIMAFDVVCADTGVPDPSLTSLLLVQYWWVHQPVGVK